MWNVYIVANLTVGGAQRGKRQRDDEIEVPSSYICTSGVWCLGLSNQLQKHFETRGSFDEHAPSEACSSVTRIPWLWPPPCCSCVTSIDTRQLSINQTCSYRFLVTTAYGDQRYDPTDLGDPVLAMTSGLVLTCSFQRNTLPQRKVWWQYGVHMHGPIVNIRLEPTFGSSYSLVSGVPDSVRSMYSMFGAVNSS